MNKLIYNLKSIASKNYLNLYAFQKLSFAIHFLHIHTNDPFIDFFIYFSTPLLLNDNFNMIELL